MIPSVWVAFSMLNNTTGQPLVGGCFLYGFNITYLKRKYKGDFSALLSNFIDQLFSILPSKAGIGDGAAWNHMIADILAAF